MQEQLQHPTADIIYGDHNIVFKSHLYRRFAVPNATEIYRRTICNPESTFFRKSCWEMYPLRTDLQITSDYDFLYEMHNRRCKMHYIPETIINFYHGGISTRKDVLREWEHLRIAWAKGCGVRGLLYHSVNLAVGAAIQFLGLLLPQRTMANIHLLRHKYHNTFLIG